MTELRVLHESTVQPEEIDALGHMNVRYYMTRVDQANRSMLAEMGIQEEPGKAIRRLDTYTRFHREQFAGATLHTLGGLIAVAGSDESREANGYFEIRNPDNNQVAASFILRSCLIDVSSQQVLDITANSVNNDTSEYRVLVPEHGMPRSLSLNDPARISLEELEAVVGDDPTPGMMSGRRKNVVHADDCDSDGRLREEVDLMFVLHRPTTGDENELGGPPVMRDSEGRRYSWAMIETRSVVWHRPMEGEIVLSIGADIANGEKWRQSRRWMFAEKTGLLLGISDSVGLCIDLDARRSIPMPLDVIEAIERTSLPQFA
ncbi:MAG: thioesterase family protein [Gammaproteobacteria bacterium]|nr:thioesterase family protein [Gammaproteobacteria bacterium]MBT5441916.1 thioesterase family protein [Gammaproteobacteria bacterium]MBT6948512.1 thioesterase family protein [Gammaproteobacteria bacterium]MBT7175655.1 thioesterase family protein [Gammaproteobacteria bacterium]MBT7721436.1 thioesterase family protein [Gammaproteobacteria bacterium]